MIKIKSYDSFLFFPYIFYMIGLMAGLFYEIFGFGLVSIFLELYILFLMWFTYELHSLLENAKKIAKKIPTK